MRFVCSRWVVNWIKFCWRKSIEYCWHITFRRMWSNWQWTGAKLNKFMSLPASKIFNKVKYLTNAIFNLHKCLSFLKTYKFIIKRFFKYIYDFYENSNVQIRHKIVWNLFIISLKYYFITYIHIKYIFNIVYCILKGYLIIEDIEQNKAFSANMF